MSFYINNTELLEAYFNGSEVSSIYYNNVLTWEAPPYVQIDYIQSSGTQYINTGVIGKSGISTEIGWMFSSAPTSYGSILSSRIAGGARIYTAYYLPGTGMVIAYNALISGKTNTVTTGTWYEYETTLENGEQHFYINGVEAQTSSTTGEVNTNYPLYAFALNEGGTAKDFAIGKMSYCKIYDNGTLVRDFIPVQMKDTAEIGLWDRVEGKFYGNDGTGKFTCDTAPLEPAWIGWDNATWEDIYNLCKAKQNGEITEWPSDVVLGATKTVTLSTSVLSSASRRMTLIGIDIDGDGVLTFQSNDMASTCAWSSSTSTTWPNSTVKDYCDDFYNYCNAKPYIKTLSKGTALTYGASITYSNENVWLISASEYGGSGSEFTKGVSTPYPYKQTLLIGNSWTRSRASSASYRQVWDTSNNLTTALATNSNRMNPCFAIG